MCQNSVTSVTLKQVVVMGTFYLSKCHSQYFFTLTWVKKCSQYFYFYQSIFKHEYLYFYLSEGLCQHIHILTAILNCNNTSQYYCFYCIFEHINAAMLSLLSYGLNFE